LYSLTTEAARRKVIAALAPQVHLRDQFLLYSALISVALNQRNPREMYFAGEAFVFL
jgi:hypothetical protein